MARTADAEFCGDVGISLPRGAPAPKPPRGFMSEEDEDEEADEMRFWW